MPLQDLRARPLEWWLREVGLTLAAVVGVVCLLSAVASVAFGIKPLVFRSGSMSPAIETGAVGIARRVAADTVHPGDIVSVTNAAGTRITHRVVEVGPGPGGTTTLVLKGDANAQPDAEQYTASHVDLVVIAVPGVGYVIAALTHPIAIFLGGAAVGALLMYAFGPGRRRPDDRPPPDESDESDEPECDGESRSGVVKRATVAGAAVIAAFGLVLAPSAQPTAAAFTDSGQAASGSFATLPRLETPTLSCSVLGIANVGFSWTAVSGATDYEFSITPTGGSTTTTTYPSTQTSTMRVGLVSSGSVTVRARRTYPSTNWYSNQSNPVNYLVAAVTLCS